MEQKVSFRNQSVYRRIAMTTLMTTTTATVTTRDHTTIRPNVICCRMKKTRGVKMSYVRNGCHITWMDRWTNEKVWDRCGVQMDVFGEVNSNTLRWFGHVELMESER